MSDVASRISGPFPIPLEELTALNTVFSDAFSERYRRDVPHVVRVLDHDLVEEGAKAVDRGLG